MSRFFVFVLFLGIFDINAQSIEIFVKSYPDNKPVSGANILFLSDDNTIINYSITSENGKIILSDSLNYSKITITKNGFEEVSIVKPEKSIEINLIKINDQVNQLDEVIIHSEKNYINQKNDTLTIYANDIRDQHTQNVRDLISKIPGINVNNETGEIKYQNKEIYTILVEGENLIDENYKILSQNLTDKIVKSLQIIEGYNETQILKGLSKTQKIAVNIKLEDGNKKKWEKSIELNFGVKNKILFDSNFFKFNKILKSVNVIQYNNIGENTVGKFIKNENQDSYVVLKNNVQLLTSDFRIFNNSESYLTQKYSGLINNSDLLTSINNTISKSDRTKIKLNLLLNNDVLKYDRKYSYVNFDNIETQNSDLFESKENPYKFKIDFSITSKLGTNQELFIDMNLFNNDIYTIINKSQIPKLDYNSKNKIFYYNVQYINRYNNKNALIISTHLQNHNSIENFKINTIQNTLQNINFYQFNYTLTLNHIHKINSKTIITTAFNYDYHFLKNRELANNYFYFKEYSAIAQYSFYNFLKRFSILLNSNMVRYKEVNLNKDKIFILPSLNYYHEKLNESFEIDLMINKKIEPFYFRSENYLINETNSKIRSGMKDVPYYIFYGLNTNYRKKFDKKNIETWFSANIILNKKPFIYSIINNSDTFIYNINPQKNNEYSFIFNIGIEKFFQKNNLYFKYIPGLETHKWLNEQNNNFVNNQNFAIKNMISLKSNFDKVLNFYLSYTHSHNLFYQKGISEIINNTYQSNDIKLDLFTSINENKIKSVMSYHLINNYNTKIIHLTSFQFKYKINNFDAELKVKNIFNIKEANEMYFYNTLLFKNDITLMERYVILGFKLIF